MPKDSEMPLVTAVIPVYNHEKYVVESVRSIIGQTYPNIELIVIDDGSKDRSREMIATVTNECRSRFSRFEYISRENWGLTATLNQALEMAKGEYFSASASDDVMLPTKFRSLVDALESNGDCCAAAIGNASFIDELGLAVSVDMNGKVQQAESESVFGTYVDFSLRSGKFGDKDEAFTYRRVLRTNSLAAPSSMLRTACIQQVGGWTAGNILDDWEMWLKLAKRYSILFVDEIVALYRIHGQNTLDTTKQGMLKAGVKLLARERDYCIRENLIAEWKDSFYRHLFGLLRYGGLPLKEKLLTLKSAKPLSFIFFLTMASMKALSSKFFRRK